MEFVHWVNGGKYPAAPFTDHKNLLTLFDDKARPISCTKPNRERLTRWGIALLSMRYEIFHIAGEHNYLADIGSRWGRGQVMISCAIIGNIVNISAHF